MSNVLMNGKAFNESALFSRSIFVLWLLRSVTLCKVRHRREMGLLQSDPVKPGLTSYQWSSCSMKIFVFRDIRQINELITCKNPVSRQLQQQSNFLEFTMIMYVLVIGLSGVCNHTSDEKVGRPRSGSPICLSRVYDYRLNWTKSSYQLIIKITISKKRKTARLWKKRKKICIKKLTKGGVNCLIDWFKLQLWM